MIKGIIKVTRSPDREFKCTHDIPSCTVPLSIPTIACIVQQGMNHDKPYFSNMSGVNMLIFMANYYSFL